MPEKIKRVIVISVAACEIALAGCWHKETQQQQFIEAINHGNSAQADQIWLHMNAKNRADFSHSQGMHPTMSPDDVKNQITQHTQDAAGGENSEDTIEKPAPNVHLGGLESLPEWVGPTGAPPPTVTVPTQNEPSN
jgi:hypothetical protein